MKVARQHIVSGSVLGGRYEVIEALGQGGMAYVYLALDRETHRHVALKLMRDELTDDPEFIRRFATEARAAASLDHPNIVRVMDYGQDQKIRYIVQEYVQGTTLKDLIVDHGPLDWDVAVPLMIQIGLALEHAHKRGIIHRDMKPQNVLISPNMVAKVTDFGIARASNANTITLTGGVAFGSVHYFSPEQARGGNVTVRSDLYSLGIMLYEMLTGELPFDGDSSVAVAIKQLQEMPLRPSAIKPDLPRALDDIIFKAIQKNPDRRYQSAREFVNELDSFMIDPDGSFGVIVNAGQNWSSGTSAIGVEKADSNFNKVDEIERSINRRRRTKIRDSILILLLVIISIFVLAYLVNYAVKRYSLDTRRSQEDIVVVERYVGKNIQAVEPELKKIYGDRYELIPVKSETQEAGIIFEQDPVYGTKLNKNDLHIVLKYSSGKNKVNLIDLSQKTEEEASGWLRANGLVPLVRKAYSDVVKRGNIVKTEPEPGTVLASGSSVVLFISQGSEDTKIPPLVSLTWTEAEKVARENGLLLRGKSIHRNTQGQLEEVPVTERVITKQLTDSGEEVKAGYTLEVEYGTAEDYRILENGGQLAGTQLVYVLDFGGRKYLDVKSYLDSIWPSGAPLYQVNMAGPSFYYNQSDLIILKQNIQPGTSFNPYETTLILTVGTPDQR